MDLVHFFLHTPLFPENGRVRAGLEMEQWSRACADLTEHQSSAGPDRVFRHPQSLTHYPHRQQTHMETENQ